jgi:hypothetical protein
MKGKLYLNFTKPKSLIKHFNKIPDKANIEAPIRVVAKLDGGKINQVTIKPIVRRASNIRFVI